MGTVDRLTELQYRRSRIEQCGGDVSVKKQHDESKLTARERIAKLFDEGSFIETDAFIEPRYREFGMDTTEAPCDGVITGFGTIDGRLAYVYSQDMTVLGGSLGEMHAKKICRIIDKASVSGAPIIGIIDSMGARLQEGVSALAGYGEIYNKLVRQSGVVPQIAMVMGPCAGGAAFMAELTDFVFMTDKSSYLSVNAPQVAAASSDSNMSSDELCSAKAACSDSGNAQFFCKDEEDCISKVRKLISFLPSNNHTEAPYDDNGDDFNRLSADLSSIVPENNAGTYDVISVIKEIADNGEFFEVSELYGKAVVTGFAKRGCYSVGIVANNGELDGNSCEKAARFVRFCDNFCIPVITLTDAEFFKADTDEELSGLARRASKLIFAYAGATTAKINIILRKAYGSAYISMCSKQLGCDVVYAWPTAEIAITSPESAANILFDKEIAASNAPVLERQARIEEYREKYASPFAAAALGYVDDIIEPDSTRPRIIAALEMLRTKTDVLPVKKQGNIQM